MTGRPSRDGGPLDLALVGWGRMGRAVEEQALARGHRILARIDPRADGADHRAIDAASVSGARVALEFTEPGAVLDNVRRLLAAGVRGLVVGTTGWSERLPEVERAVDAAGAGLVHAANFSVGVNLFLRIVERAAALADGLPGYDLHVEERHHAGKADSPSGTARVLAEAILRRARRKTQVITDRLDRPARPEELHVVAVRAGHDPGTHRVVLDSPGDTIELIHRSRSRVAFASGAVLAAEWIAGRKGVFTFSDVLDGVTTGEET